MGGLSQLVANSGLYHTSPIIGIGSGITRFIRWDVGVLFHNYFAAVDEVEAGGERLKVGSGGVPFY